MEYEEKRNNLINERETILSQIKKMKNRIDALPENKRKMQMERFSEDWLPEKMASLETIEKKLKYIRPDDEKDTKYRKSIIETYNQTVCEAIPDELHLLFHGTPIYYAEDIIKSQGILSPVERNSTINHDCGTGTGKIWVTNKLMDDGIQESLTFSDVNESCMPIGCIFVMRTDEKTEMQSTNSKLTNSISFKDNPDVLFSIITSHENCSMIQKLCKQNDIDPDKVQTFDSFLQILQNRDYSQIRTDKSNSKILEGVVQATEELTKTSDINGQVSIIRENTKEKQRDVDKEKG